MLAPATAAKNRVHEGAHLATGARYPHTSNNTEEILDEPDFVARAGIVVFEAVYWHAWLPEARRIDEMYFDLESGGPQPRRPASRARGRGRHCTWGVWTASDGDPGGLNPRAR